MGDRAVDRPHHAGVALRLFLQTFPLPLQRFEPVETRRIENGPDVSQRDIQFAMDQNLLQSQQFLGAIVAIAVLAGECGLEQSNLVIMVQGSHRNARKPGKLIDGIGSHRLASSAR
ncbi:hypothetical protein D3C71_1662270 [compost metagenome]